MEKIDKTLQAIRRIDDSPDLVDIMINIEDYLDRNDLYAFKNWIDGELIDGPYIKTYWIKVSFKWNYKKMPDPMGAARLLPHGTKIFYRKEKENVPQPIKKPSDYQPGTHKPKIKAEDVWVVDMLIPRRFIEDLDSAIIDIYSDKVDNIDSVRNANVDNSANEEDFNSINDNFGDEL